MKHFHRIDTLFGWLTFAIAFTVYGLTIEPTASFWDCPEFIIAGYKLEIGHQPGAPFFMLVANLFSQLSGNTEHVAMMVNLLSAFLSALTILFLFWTISHLVRRLIVSTNENGPKTRKEAAPSVSQTIIIIGAALVGSLVYTFSDTFWFSAVEGEVYAFSSAFTAVVFWLILKWEDHADEPQSDRWLILIAYLMGLSIGVHLLNLLCLPAIVLVFCFHRFPNIRTWGVIAALLASFALIGVILFVIIPGVTTVGGWFELLFVNHLGLPFNSGFLVYLIILFPALILAIAYAQRRQLRILNTSLLCFLMLLLGYGSYAVTFVRASANTPMNQNAPKDIFSLGRYLARDQYEHGPLLYGQAYSSQPQLRIEGNYCVPEIQQGKTIYQPKPKEEAGEKDQYIVTGHHIEYVYAQNMWFPRMWNPRHADAYEAWTGGNNGKEVWYDRCGEMVSVTMPSQWDNLRFFFGYQCNFMYWRYFLWNFAGRQNDIQSHGEPEHGNWLSGVSLLDNWRLGDQRLLPTELQHNRGHNVYFCLPLLLGLLGLWWQSACCRRHGRQQFWVVLMLFLMTGLAIVVYINQTPMQPRERDYAYAGSFYAFAIWCGMGVVPLARALRYCRKSIPATVSAAVTTLLSLGIPVLMATQNWDDHDRSGRYICRDAGYNYLSSLPDEGNPIILTNGDNDTFPLWYAQEVEGYRSDARVCNLQYMQTDWYIDQLRRPAYDSPGLPIDWEPADYITGQNDVYDLTDLDTDTLHLSDQWDIPLKGRRKLYKNELALLELLRHSDERPVYVATSVGESDYLNLDDHTVIEGLAARFVPSSSASNASTPSDTTSAAKPTSGQRMDTARTYQNLMTRFRFTGINDPSVYLDETARGMAYRYRRLFAQLALQLIAEGFANQTDKDSAANQSFEQAQRVLKRADEAIPLSCLPADYILGNDIDIARAYRLLGNREEAYKRLSLLYDSSRQMLEYFQSLSATQQTNNQTAIGRHLYILRHILEEAQQTDEGLARRIEQHMRSQLNAFNLQ